MKTPYTFKFPFLAILFLLVVLGAVSPVLGQQVTYGNEWINFSQKYYKIKVPATGLYRLDRNYLLAAGITGVDPQTLKLYRRGKEVAIHVTGQADGSLDAGDYLEFYGEKNDGALDVELYKDPSLQINPYYSVYTDTAAYFLTWSAGAGKRMEVRTTNSAGLTPEPWFWQTRLLQITDQYSRGKPYGSNNMSWMDSAEGFMSSSSSGTRNVVVDSLLNLYTQGPKPVVEVALAGSNASTPDVDVFAVNGTSVRLLGNVMFDIYGSTKRSFPLEFSDIAANGRVTIRFVSKNGSATRVSYIKVTFPQRPVMYVAAMNFQTVSSNAPSFLYTFEGTHAPNAVAYDITSSENVIKIEGAANGSQKSFVFEGGNSSASRQGFVWAKAPMVPPSAVEVKFRSFAGNKASYLILTHKSLMLAGGTSANPVKDYAAYRASVAGGGHDTLVVDVDQVYDQFFYGDKSAASIRRFMKFMLANGTPQFLFIIGKGIETDNINVRKNPMALASRDLVPTGGLPSSDVFFTSDWEADKYEPKVATGRLPAQVPGDVLAYLDKVKEHEALPQNAEWRKNFLHLGGGTSAEEGNRLENYLNSYKKVAEGPLLGAEVKTRARESLQDLETINVSAELNKGLSLITFFGHSSTTTSDLDIGYVSAPQNGYNNKGKYPMILMNGCGAGNSSTASISFGEDWLLTPNKGALLFMAHTSTGYPTLLHAFSRTFYEIAFASEDTYGKPVGIIHKELVKQLDNSIAGFNAKAMLMQMDLKGDPAVALVAPEKPDYAISNSSISIKSLDGKPLSAATEKFAVTVDVRNLGKAITAPFYVRVKRLLQNGEVLQKDSVLVPFVYNRDTLEVAFESKVPVPGINYFEASVDSQNEVEELDEANNTARLEYFLPVSSVLALAPKQYSIVPTQTVKLVGQSTNLLSAAPEYYFEIDTTSTFKSAWKKSAIIQGGTLPIWEVLLLPNTAQNDSVVYFWRFRNREVSAQEDTVWANSSFRYIPSSLPGWSQSKFAQLTEVGLKEMEVDKTSKRIEYRKNIDKYIMIRGVGGNIHFGFPPNSIYIEGNRTIDADCFTDRPNMMAIVFNDKTLEPYLGMPAGLARICGRAPSKVTYNFVDLRVPENLVKLEEFLRSVPEGYYVAMVGMRAVPYNTMSESLKAQFRSIGSSMIDKLVAGDPYAIVGQKGALPGTATEVGPDAEDPSPAADQSIFLEAQIRTSLGIGSFTSTLIGPATEWKTLKHQVALESTDSYQLDVIGVGWDGEETEIFTDVNASSFDISSVDAKVFPYLKLKLSTKDLDDRTAPQLQEWLVLYNEVPEGVLRPDLVGLQKYETISEQASAGEVDLQFAFHNITNINFGGELKIDATLFKEDGSSVTESFKVPQLVAEDTVYFNYKFSTIGMTGANRLRISVNPPPGLPEQNYFNNTVELPFTVGAYSGMPPVVDVVFDGARILDGDIVSPSPVISIQLKDNSGKLPIKQSQKMKVYLQRPGSSQAEEIMVNGNPDVRMYPADQNNDLRVEYNPKMLPDGIYTLEAEGLDGNNNKLGGTYKINFEVENESSVTNFYPYPNPFSSKTRFVFTLTGSYIPERMKIQIMTVTGKVVREIQREELGAIKIGNNISEFAWDGTDEFGDRLANGVYLYRVVMDKGPTEMKHRGSAGDKAFKEGYGKIYILR